MTKTAKAVLLSGLVCPGTGHLLLKRRARGWTLIVAALLAIGATLTIAIQSASTVANSIVSGEVALDSAAIAEAIADASSESENYAMNGALILFGACWVIGVCDSFRLGVVADRLPE